MTIRDDLRRQANTHASMFDLFSRAEKRIEQLERGLQAIRDHHARLNKARRRDLKDSRTWNLANDALEGTP